jgi:hypothetical protein
MFKKIFTLMLLCTTPLVAQTAQVVTTSAPTIRVAEVGDSTKFTINWPTVQGSLFYDFGMFGNPRAFDVEMVRTITGTPTWTVTALRTNLYDGMKIYVTIRTVSSAGIFLAPIRASITYYKPVPPPQAFLVYPAVIPGIN